MASLSISAVIDLAGFGGMEGGEAGFLDLTVGVFGILHVASATYGCDEALTSPVLCIFRALAARGGGEREIDMKGNDQ